MSNEESDDKKVPAKRKPGAGRKGGTKTPAPEPKGADPAAVEDALAKEGELLMSLAEIDAHYGDGQPYDRDRIVDETRFFVRQSAEATLEAGRRLVQLKEHEEHGSYERALEEIGVKPRAARKLTQAAAKFTGNKALIAEKVDKCKLLELMTEDDEELEALAEGGTLAGATLDEIDQMSVRELKEALRKNKEDRKADQEKHERQLERKNQEIDKLAGQLDDKENGPSTWQDEVFEINATVTRTAAKAVEAFDGLEQMIEKIRTTETASNPAALKEMALLMYDTVERVMGAAANLMMEAQMEFQSFKDEAAPVLTAGEE